MAQFPISQELRSAQALVRFGLRMIILVVFAAFAGIGFGKGLAALLWMSAIFSAVTGAMKRERLLDTTLNHWDETVVYLALGCLFTGLNPALPA